MSGTSAASPATIEGSGNGRCGRRATGSKVTLFSQYHRGRQIKTYPLAGIHVLAADDARAVGLGEFGLGRVRIALVHIVSRAAVLHHVGQARDKGAECVVEIADDVQRDAIEREDHTEEAHVQEQLEEV